jgi:peptidyl-prolyl cis-trans isomerase C
MKLRPLAGALFVALVGCNEAPLQPLPDAGPPVAGLPADQAARTIARVGDRTITLGDFARTLERMDQFDRLRYQSKERRRELLEELVDVELLAAEARHQGLDKDPETADALRVILREALLNQTSEKLPTPAQLGDQEVRDYYESHADKFSEPERRRVAAIVMSDKKEAAKVLKDALKVKSAPEWGELFAKHSLTAPKPTRGPANPAELAGDLGIVGPMEDAHGNNPKVPDPIRAVAFKIKDVSEVFPDLVEVEGRQFIVRLQGITKPHKRTLAEADRAIRVLLIQEKANQIEHELQVELEKKFPVEIDEAALAAVKIPTGIDKAEPPPEREHPRTSPDDDHQHPGADDHK